tara:strand:- start:244 stop:726 length:483 start_codon:yes stop_codon:yes gene_type:complete
MKKILLLIIFISSIAVNAETIASCEGLKGQSYYPDIGMYTDKDNSGWQDDGISNGKTSVIRNGDSFDILFVDTLGDINSSKDQGAEIRLVMIDKNSFSLTSLFLNASIEIYSFWKNKEGNYRYSLTQVKGGSSLIPKNSLLIGSCSSIKFSWIEEMFGQG